MSQTATHPLPNPTDEGSFELDPGSYVESRLKHASPEHLHLTSRRFFIGPIPEGWLNSNRKSWYNRRLELNNYSSRQATFAAAAPESAHRRTGSGLELPSVAARIRFSFPQPEDVFEEDEQNQDRGRDNGTSEDDTDGEVGTTALAPVSTVDAARFPDSVVPDQVARLRAPASAEDGASEVSAKTHGQSVYSTGRAESFQTAPEHQKLAPQSITPQVETEQDRQEEQEDSTNRPSSSTHGAGSLAQLNGFEAALDNIDATSRTALLEDNDGRPTVAEVDQQPKSMIARPSDPLQSSSVRGNDRQKARGVRFKVAGEVADRQKRISKRVDSARHRVTQKVIGREALKEGTIVKMERMLVRIDLTAQQLPEDFDENESVKTETKQIEKWREFMVVARKSSKKDDDDFRLQFYQTRVIPETETASTKKRPAREIKLLPKSTHVNLYSTLDKTVVIWHPYKKGTRIFILRPTSAAHSVEWYTFLRDALGWHRPPTLRVNVPDLDVVLHLEKPFEGLEAAGLDTDDIETAINQTVKAEKAVAGRIISQSVEILRKDPEWTEVLKRWSETARMGLAWKRYDRLEWIHGVNEQKMFGSMAMEHSYDLELRPKHHYPTSTHGKKGVLHPEPAPIEGFLIRLTSQKGIHKRFGKAFFKRLYFSTHDQFLVFNRPAKATPPHPPRLATIGGTNVPTSSEIIRKTPLMYEVEPFEIEDGQIRWLKSNQRHTVRQHDVEAAEEAKRNVSNLLASDGYINLCDIAKIRVMKWGAGETDETLDSGSEVDFHADVANTTREDGTVQEIDDDRTFELLLHNRLVIRLQAYDTNSRDEWIRRLKKLVKYWKLRIQADITNLKAVRQSNLTHLNIDEDMEAQLGQFAHKWEVNRSDASPELYNMCRLTACRTITMSGMLYRKPRRHATFQRCGVLLAGGQMVVYQATLRKGTGEQIPHIHQEKQQVIDLKDCYVYSGMIVEEELLYQNRTFDANHAGMLAATPRIYLEDGWTSADVDVMTCFVIWTNRRKGWFRSVTSDGGWSSAQDGGGQKNKSKGSTRSKLKRVAQLGVPGRAMVFKCRSRAERDLWVLAVAAEIEAAVERELCEHGQHASQDLAEVRLEQS